MIYMKVLAIFAIVVVCYLYVCSQHKPEAFHDATYCGDCSDLPLSKCDNCTNCGLCINGENVECVAGTVLGPHTRSCDRWVFGRDNTNAYAYSYAYYPWWHWRRYMFDDYRPLSYRHMPRRNNWSRHRRI